MMSFKEALEFRHACKIFDDSKRVSDEQFEEIIGAAILSPSSMGMEPWDFWLVENLQLKEQIKKVAWNQAQITTCSHLLVILAKIGEVRANSEYVQKMFARRVDKSEQERAGYLKKYGDFCHNNIGQSDEQIFAWTKAQCYLAAQNMMMQAAMLGIDSCPIEGFEQNELKKLLQLDSSKHNVAMMVCFGYRLNPQSKKIRRDKSDILRVLN